MSRPDSALLFAAGMGTRMRPLTDTRPKPLVEVAGRPLFDHALDLLQDAGLRRIVANTHYLAPQMSAHLARRNVTESHEPRLLDTGGGLKQALPLLGDPVITLNTDAVWTGGSPLPAMLRHWDPAKMDGLVLLVPRAAAVGHAGKGDFLLAPDGRITPGPGLVYTGLQIVTAAPFLRTEDAVFGMYRIWTQMMATGRLHGIVHTGGWADVGRPDGISLAENMLRQAHV